MFLNFSRAMSWLCHVLAHCFDFHFLPLLVRTSFPILKSVLSFFLLSFLLWNLPVHFFYWDVCFALYWFVESPCALTSLSIARFTNHPFSILSFFFMMLFYKQNLKNIMQSNLSVFTLMKRHWEMKVPALPLDMLLSQDDARNSSVWGYHPEGPLCPSLPIQLSKMMALHFQSYIVFPL